MTPERRRLGRIKRWLELEFPLWHPTRLRYAVMPHGYRDCLGTYDAPEGGRPAMIRISTQCTSISQMIDVIMHEWSHARCDPDSEAAGRRHGGHTNEFYLEFGRIERTLLRALDGELKRRG